MRRTMLLLPLLAACGAGGEPPMRVAGTPGDLSPAAVAAIPAGLRAADVWRSPAGCYAVIRGNYMEALVGPDGRQLCD